MVQYVFVSESGKKAHSRLKGENRRIEGETSRKKREMSEKKARGKTEK